MYVSVCLIDGAKKAGWEWMCVCMSLVWQRLVNCRKFTIHTAHISAIAWECMLKMTSCARLCALCVYVYTWEQPHGRIRFLHCSIVKIAKIKWDIVFTQVRTAIIQTESKLKYCQPHTTHYNSFVFFLSSSLFYSGGKTSFTHSENKKCEAQNVLHKSENIERRVRKARGEERMRLRAPQIYSWNGMSIWRFFPYTWYWYCALTIYYYMLCVCVRVVCALCCCNLLAVWPCCGLFCLAFLFSCVSCCRSAEINLYIGLSHTVQREKYSSFDSVRQELIIYEVQQKAIFSAAFPLSIGRKIPQIDSQLKQVKFVQSHSIKIQLEIIKEKTRIWSKNGARQIFNVYCYGCSNSHLIPTKYVFFAVNFLILLAGIIIWQCF